MAVAAARGFSDAFRRVPVWLVYVAGFVPALVTQPTDMHMTDLHVQANHGYLRELGAIPVRRFHSAPFEDSPVQ